MLHDNDPKLCKPDSLKNGLQIIKGIFNSLIIGKICMRKSSPNVFRVFMNCWSRIGIALCLVLLTLGVNITTN
jgi:hypothetical protein